MILLKAVTVRGEMGNYDVTGTLKKRNERVMILHRVIGKDVKGIHGQDQVEKDVMEKLWVFEKEAVEVVVD